MLSAAFRNLLYSALPKPAILSPENRRGVPVKCLLVLSNGPNPTFAYYLQERIKHTPLPALTRHLDDPIAGIDPNGVYVIICRYVGLRHLLWLCMHRHRLAGVCLLMDDDIAATVTGKGGTLSYKIFLSALGIAPLPVLNRLLSDIWVSTPQLAQKLSFSKTLPPVVVPPFPPLEYCTPIPSSKARDKVAMAFHSTGVHDGEHEFLLPIVREAMLLCPKLQFEVTTSNRKLERLWKNAGLPPERLRIKPHRNWVDYLTDTKHGGVDILLVPLLHNPTNEARSDTKRFDSARMGAAAIFSRGQVYGRSASVGEMLLDNDHDAWVETILKLAGDQNFRLKVKQATDRAIRTSLANTKCTLPLFQDNAGNQDYATDKS